MTSLFFFFNDTATTEIYTLSLHDALPISVRFDVTDGKRTIAVAYQGLLPDLFREGQGVVAEGVLDSAGTFRADSVLAKHDETYMPKDVADALKKQGHWKDDYERKLGAAAQGRAQ